MRPAHGRTAMQRTYGGGLGRTALLRGALLLAALACAPGAARAQADPLRLQLFSTTDVAVAPVGGAVRLRVEALAVPATEAAAEALVAAVATLAPDGGPDLRRVDAGPAVVRRTGDVLEVRRTFTFRVASAAVRAVPAIPLRVLGQAHATRPHALRAYAPSDAPERAGRSVLAVVADGPGGRRAGSAFVAADGALVTAYHVVAGARRVRVRLPDGRTLRTARVWALDPARDVAVLAADAVALTRAGAAPLALAAEAAEGPVAFTAGWPGGAQRRTVGARFADLHAGGGRTRVAASRVRPGDSGGPLLDADGRVLGVVVSGRADGPVPLAGPAVRGEALAFAADVRPALALAARRAGARPERLGRALARAAREAPAARVAEAAAALRAAPRASAAAARARRDLLDAARRADAPVQLLAATALDAAGQPAEARAALDAAAAAGYAPAAYALAALHLRQGDTPAAAGLFASLRERPAFARAASFGLAQIAAAEGRAAEAAALVEPALDADPDDAPALFLLGLARLAEGDTARARALVVRLAAQPAWADALRLLVETPALAPARLRPLPRAGEE